MFKLILALLLRLHNPTVNCEHHYTLAQMVDDNPYSLHDWNERSAAPYTVKAWEVDMAKRACQCFMVKVSPEGHVIGQARDCSCEE
jgi:hypothetical protein